MDDNVIGDENFLEMSPDEYHDYMRDRARNRTKQPRQIVYAYLDSPGLWYTDRAEAALENPDRDPDTLEKFDSQTEHRRYCELHTLARAGDIVNLQCHPTFVLSEKQGVTFTPDFSYTRPHTGERVIEDVKGLTAQGTPLVWAAFRIKMAWFRDKYPEYRFELTTA